MPIQLPSDSLVDFSFLDDIEEFDEDEEENDEGDGKEGEDEEEALPNPVVEAKIYKTYPLFVPDERAKALIVDLEKMMGINAEVPVAPDGHIPNSAVRKLPRYRPIDNAITQVPIGFGMWDIKMLLERQRMGEEVDEELFRAVLERYLTEQDIPDISFGELQKVKLKRQVARERLLMRIQQYPEPSAEDEVRTDVLERFYDSLMREYELSATVSREKRRKAKKKLTKTQLREEKLRKKQERDAELELKEAELIAEYEKLQMHAHTTDEGSIGGIFDSDVHKILERLSEELGGKKMVFQTFDQSLHGDKKAKNQLRVMLRDSTTLDAVTEAVLSPRYVFSFLTAVMGDPSQVVDLIDDVHNNRDGALATLCSLLHSRERGEAFFRTFWKTRNAVSNHMKKMNAAKSHLGFTRLIDDALREKDGALDNLAEGLHGDDYASESVLNCVRECRLSDAMEILHELTSSSRKESGALRARLATLDDVKDLDDDQELTEGSEEEGEERKDEEKPEAAKETVVAVERAVTEESDTMSLDSTVRAIPKVTVARGSTSSSVSEFQPHENLLSKLPPLPSFSEEQWQRHLADKLFNIVGDLPKKQLDRLRMADVLQVDESFIEAFEDQQKAEKLVADAYAARMDIIRQLTAVVGSKKKAISVLNAALNMEENARARLRDVMGSEEKTDQMIKYLRSAKVKIMESVLRSQTVEEDEGFMSSDLSSVFRFEEKVRDAMAVALEVAFEEGKLREKKNLRNALQLFCLSQIDALGAIADCLMVDLPPDDSEISRLAEETMTDEIIDSIINLINDNYDALIKLVGDREDDSELTKAQRQRRGSDFLNKVRNRERVPCYHLWKALNARREAQKLFLNLEKGQQSLSQAVSESTKSPDVKAYVVESQIGEMLKSATDLDIPEDASISLEKKPTVLPPIFEVSQPPPTQPISEVPPPPKQPISEVSQPKQPIFEVPQPPKQLTSEGKLATTKVTKPIVPIGKRLPYPSAPKLPVERRSSDKDKKLVKRKKQEPKKLMKEGLVDDAKQQQEPDEVLPEASASTLLSISTVPEASRTQSSIDLSAKILEHLDSITDPEVIEAWTKEVKDEKCKKLQNLKHMVERMPMDRLEKMYKFVDSSVCKDMDASTPEMATHIADFLSNLSQEEEMTENELDGVLNFVMGRIKMEKEKEKEKEKERAREERQRQQMEEAATEPDEAKEERFREAGRRKDSIVRQMLEGMNDVLQKHRGSMLDHLEAFLQSDDWKLGRTTTKGQEFVPMVERVRELLLEDSVSGQESEEVTAATRELSNAIQMLLDSRLEGRAAELRGDKFAQFDSTEDVSEMESWTPTVSTPDTGQEQPTTESAATSSPEPSKKAGVAPELGTATRVKDSSEAVSTARAKVSPESAIGARVKVSSELEPSERGKVSSELEPGAKTKVSPEEEPSERGKATPELIRAARTKASPEVGPGAGGEISPSSTRIAESKASPLLFQTATPEHLVEAHLEESTVSLMLGSEEQMEKREAAELADQSHVFHPIVEDAAQEGATIEAIDRTLDQVRVMVSPTDGMTRLRELHRTPSAMDQQQMEGWSVSRPPGIGTTFESVVGQLTDFELQLIQVTSTSSEPSIVSPAPGLLRRTQSAQQPEEGQEIGPRVSKTDTQVDAVHDDETRHRLRILPAVQPLQLADSADGRQAKVDRRKQAVPDSQDAMVPPAEGTTRTEPSQPEPDDQIPRSDAQDDTDSSHKSNVEGADMRLIDSLEFSEAKSDSSDASEYVMLVKPAAFTHTESTDSQTRKSSTHDAAPSVSAATDSGKPLKVPTAPAVSRQESTLSEAPDGLLAHTDSDQVLHTGGWEEMERDEVVTPIDTAGPKSPTIRHFLRERIDTDPIGIDSSESELKTPLLSGIVRRKWFPHTDCPSTVPDVTQKILELQHDTESGTEHRQMMSDIARIYTDVGMDADLQRKVTESLKEQFTDILEHELPRLEEMADLESRGAHPLLTLERKNEIRKCNDAFQRSVNIIDGLAALGVPVGAASKSKLVCRMREMSAKGFWNVKLLDYLETGSLLKKPLQETAQRLTYLARLEPFPLTTISLLPPRPEDLGVHREDLSLEPEPPSTKAMLEHLIGLDDQFYLIKAHERKVCTISSGTPRSFTASSSAHSGQSPTERPISRRTTTDPASLMVTADALVRPPCIVTADKDADKDSDSDGESEEEYEESDSDEDREGKRLKTKTSSGTADRLSPPSLSTSRSVSRSRSRDRKTTLNQYLREDHPEIARLMNKLPITRTSYRPSAAVLSQLPRYYRPEEFQTSSTSKKPQHSAFESMTVDGRERLRKRTKPEIETYLPKYGDSMFQSRLPSRLPAINADSPSPILQVDTEKQKKEAEGEGPRPKQIKATPSVRTPWPPCARLSYIPPHDWGRIGISRQTWKDSDITFRGHKVPGSHCAYEDFTRRIRSDLGFNIGNHLGRYELLDMISASIYNTATIHRRKRRSKTHHEFFSLQEQVQAMRQRVTAREQMGFKP